MIKNRVAKSVFIFVSISFVLFYIQNQYAISCIDDWWYAFVEQPEASNIKSVTDDEAIRQPVQSLKDAWLSQQHDYFKTNGRFLVHTLVQYFCGTWEMRWFVVANSIIFSLLILLITQLTRSEHQPQWLHWLTVWLAIWLLMPHKGLTFMGNIALSVNYLWVSVATLIFVIIVENLMRKDEKRPLQLTFLFIVSLMIGSLQESFSIGISGALLCYTIYMKGKVGIGLKVVSLSYLTGTMFCLFSPANFGRFDDIGGMGFHPHSLLGLLSSPPVLLSAVLIITVWRKGWLNRLIADNHLLIVSSLINILFALFIAYNGRHQLTAVNLLLLVMILRVWMKTPLFTLQVQRTILAVLIITAVLSYWPILKVRKHYYDSYTMITEQALQTENGIVDGYEFEAITNDIQHNRLLECNYVFTFTFDNWDMFERGLSIWLTQGRDVKLVTTVLPESNPQYYITR